ncbi:MAG: peptidase [Bacteroidetes bacterium]|nr:peptidase [Bacteroidota bacterium]
MIKKTILLLLFPTILSAQKDTIALRYSQNISAAGMSKNLHVLASDEYEGRETGKKGQKMAAEYIAAQFKAAGIPPYKENTYFQHYPLNLILPAPAEVSINGRTYAGNQDYYSFPGQTEQTINTGNVLFLGYGIDEPAYSDYREADVKGRVVMIMGGEPYGKDSVSLISGKKTPSLWSTYYKLKPEKAREKGAMALLIVVDDIRKGIQDNKHKLESPSMKLDLGRKEMPVIYISTEMANAILKRTNVEKVKKKISSSGKPYKKTAKTKFAIIIKNTVQKIEAENVLGYIEGSDLKEELIVITAHYDHLGIDGTVVFNGADDDGSGTVAVIQLAEAFAKAKREGHGSRRSMLFMTVSGEEKGLLGSSYYADHPEFPLKNTVCDLNIDMIGRLDEKHTGNPNYVYLIGSDKLSSQLNAISENANKAYTNLELDYTFNDENDRNRFYYRSDHYNFAKNGIPVIFYFNGVHADYHKETDEVEKIDFAKMEKITKLVFFTAWELANRDERIKVDSNKK